MCTQCGLKFYRKGDFKRHFKSHTGDKSLTLDQNGKGLAKTGFYVEDLKTHASNKDNVLQRQFTVTTTYDKEGSNTMTDGLSESEKYF